MKKRLISVSGAGFVASFLLLFFLAATPSLADDEKTQLKEVQDKIKAQKEKLDATQRLESTTLGDIDKINRELGRVADDLTAYRKTLAETEGRIGAVKAEISTLEHKLGKRKSWMQRKLLAIYRFGRYGEIVRLVESSENVSEMSRRWKYLEVLALHERKIIEEYGKDLDSLDAKQKDLGRLYGKFRQEKEKVELTERGLEGKKKQKETVLASVRKEKDSYEKMLAELKAASERLLELIKESEGKKYAGDGFRGLKGGLPWPVGGKVAIPYGTQRDPEFKTPVFRNGIYIEAPDGSVAEAVHSGKVAYADWFKGYGKLVIINHGDGYHSLYANLSEIFLKPGDIIKRKAGIGRVGESGLLNKPALYFEIRYKGKPLDPVQWLKGG